VTCLLRIAADGTWREAATEHVYRRHSAAAVREACVTVLSVILFNRRTDPHRVLGLQAGASEDEVRDHKRLLLKWLHPDRNPARQGDGRERELLTRVLEAAAEIEGKRPVTMDAAPPPIPPRPSPGRRPPQQQATMRESDAGDPPAQDWERSFKLRLARGLSASFHSLRRACYACAVLLATLILWRYVMQEPIGVSLHRYSQAAMGFASW
jgi:hypothetical protein